MSVLFEKWTKPTLIDKIKKVFLKYRLKFIDVKSSILSIEYHQKKILNEIALVLDVSFGDYLRKKKPYLSSIQVEGLIENGFTIGAHSIDHPKYELLTIEEQLYQTIQSVKIIKFLFSLDYGAFAFPFNDDGVNKKYFDEVFKIIDISFGASDMKTDSCSKNLQRFWMEATFREAKEIVSMQYAVKLLRNIIGKNKIIRN